MTAEMVVVRGGGRGGGGGGRGTNRGRGGGRDWNGKKADDLC